MVGTYVIDNKAIAAGGTLITLGLAVGPAGLTAAIEAYRAVGAASIAGEVGGRGLAWSCVAPAIIVHQVAIITSWLSCTQNQHSQFPLKVDTINTKLQKRNALLEKWAESVLGHLIMPLVPQDMHLPSQHTLRSSKH